MRNRTKFRLVFLGIVVFGDLTSASVRPSAKTFYMKDTDVAQVKIHLGKSTVLSFPTRPSKLVVGNKNQFAVEYIENDVAITALHSSARSNLIVYLQARRFCFDLSTSQKEGDEILLIRDSVARPRAQRK